MLLNFVLEITKRPSKKKNEEEEEEEEEVESFKRDCAHLHSTFT